MSEQNGGDDEDLFVGDILGAGKNEDVLRHEIAEELSAMDPTAIKHTEEIRKIFGETSRGILDRLLEMGVNDASTLIEDLSALGSREQNPDLSDIETVAAHYEAVRDKPQNPADRRRLKSLGSLANSVSCIVSANVISMLQGENTDLAVDLRDHAEETVDLADVDAITKGALRSLVQELKSPPDAAQ